MVIEFTQCMFNAGWTASLLRLQVQVHISQEIARAGTRIKINDVHREGCSLSTPTSALYQSGQWSSAFKLGGPVTAHRAQARDHLPQIYDTCAQV